MDEDLQLILNCITWAVNHGYNPFDSTVSKPNLIHYKLYKALDNILSPTIESIESQLNELKE